MSRLIALILSAVVCFVSARPAAAEDPPKKLTADERKELETRWDRVMSAGVKSYQAGQLADATKAFADALAVARKVWNSADFPDGHSDLAMTASNLALLLKHQGKLAEAEALFLEAHTMNKRLFKGTHPHVAIGMNNLATLYQAQGRLGEAEPLFVDALAMLRELFKGNQPDVAQALNNLAGLYIAQGRFSAAEPLLTDALKMHKRLARGDSADVARSTQNLAELFRVQGRYVEAERLHHEALAMYKRVYKGDHPETANCTNNLALLLSILGKGAEAEPLVEEALAAYRRLFKGDHPETARCLNNLAQLRMARVKPDGAEQMLEEALAMYKRLFKGIHPDAALCLDNLAKLRMAVGNYDEAEPLIKDALAIRKKLFPGDHPDVARSLEVHAQLYRAQGKWTEAEEMVKNALAMHKRIYPGDHREVAVDLNVQAQQLQFQGKLDEAESLYTEALGMQKRLLIGYAAVKSEGDALNLANSQAMTLDGLQTIARLRAARATGFDPTAAYSSVWTAKGMIARIFEQRQLQARAAAVADPEVAKQLDQLADARRLRAELLLAPATKDPGTLKARGIELKTLDERIGVLTRQTIAAFSAVARLDRLNAATSADLQKAMPPDAVLVDYLLYTDFEWDDTKPAGRKLVRVKRYVAFVVTRDRITRIDLDLATLIDPAAASWRDAIKRGGAIPAAAPANVRDLVWEKVRKSLPAATKTVYVCPDADLCVLPFAALPGDKPGTILLEDFALAFVPHGPFLLDQLGPQDERKSASTLAMVVGAVKYDSDAAVPGAVVNRRDPLVKPGRTTDWPFLPNSVGELNGIATLAAKRKFPLSRIEGDKATAAAVIEALPKARVAHFATHGFFADPSFRGVFQLEDKDFENIRGERIGRVANNPLLMTGLVFAGANHAGTPGRGILTGEQLIDRDLSGLELAVLSACETGLGDLGAGGEGVFGLQRAFHYCGTKNVVASLWKVPDASTAALMSLFYSNLWEKNLPPLESLRQAQMHLYRNPQDAPELAQGFRGKFDVVKDAVEAKPIGGKGHPLLWAGFTLSGLGK